MVERSSSFRIPAARHRERFAPGRVSTSLIGGALLLALSACSQVPAASPPDPKPQWERYAFEGVYPTMPIAAVEQNLKERGYVIEPCGSVDPQPSAPVWQDGRTNCYISETRKWRVLMSAVQTKQGYYADDFAFHSTDGIGTKQENAGKSQAFFEKMQEQLGKPRLSNTIGETQSRSHYWFVPGGSKTLPDMAMMKTGEPFGLNYTMTSHWIHKQGLAEASAESVKPNKKEQK